MKSKFNFDAAKINKPFQFNAIVIMCATIITYFYLYFGFKLDSPYWGKALLIISSVSFLPLLIFFSIFFMIKYRDKYQEDEYYSEFQSKIKDIKIQQLSISDEALIKEEDTKKALEGISEIDKNEIPKWYKEAHKWLLANGIYTKQKLSEFSSAKHVINKLSEIYKDELLRPKDHPLDPIAFATWGSILFVNDLDNLTVSAVKRTIQASQEYKDKHCL